MKFLKKIDKNFLYQFGTYLIVGGIATLVEWGLYYLFDPVAHLNTYLATALAFILSTLANWGAGRLLTFRHAQRPKLVKELAMIYAAAVIGLGLNELIMYLMLHFVVPGQTDFQKMLSKVVATGLVFFWNFFIRKLVIYRDRDQA